ncbi:hypothetical protein G6F57_022625 [Rhizopus arrhizus]|nr:hypothetical protein G6F57_022625 [Rhizopus arrhizus]
MVFVAQRADLVQIDLRAAELAFKLAGQVQQHRHRGGRIDVAMRGAPRRQCLSGGKRLLLGKLHRFLADLQFVGDAFFVHRADEILGQADQRDTDHLRSSLRQDG